MNTNHASIFTVLGTLMHLIPVLMPELFPAAGTGAGTRELWLQFMGAVNFTIGAGWLTREAWQHLTVVRVRMRHAGQRRPVGVGGQVRSAA